VTNLGHKVTNLARATMKRPPMPGAAKEGIKRGFDQVDPSRLPPLGMAGL